MSKFWSGLVSWARTSEFWAALFVTVTQVIGDPAVPDDLSGDYATAKVVMIVYAALRVVSKMSKKIPDQSAPKVGAALLVAGLLAAGSAKAQEPVSLLDVGSRGHVNVTSGAMFLSSGEDWSGASIGAVAGYNLHPKLSVAAGYDRGVALNDVDEDLDVFRGWISMPLTTSVYAGFGYAKFDDATKGGFAQLVLSKPVMKRLNLSLVYAHVFPTGDLEDFEQARAVVSYHLLGKE